jgi:hypothetical protein
MAKAKKKAAKTHKSAPAKPQAPAAAQETTPQTAAAGPRRRMPSEADQFATVRELARGFLTKIPPAANSSGHLDVDDAAIYAVENGLYRIAGTDWIFQFRHQRFVEVQRAAPPNFGGPNVIIVPAA